MCRPKFIWLLSLPVLISCSIKESRTECPCYALINLDEYAELPETKDVLLTVQNGREVRQKEVSMLDCLGKGHEEVVSRSSTIFCSASGYEDMDRKSDSIRAPKNAEWGKLFSDGQVVDCNDDVRDVLMRPHKEYCTVIFLVVGIPTDEPQLYDMRVRANSNGIRLRDNRPLSGSYIAYITNSFVGSVSSIRIPRQEDDEMVLDLLLHRENRDYTVDDKVTTFPLGRMIKTQGFSWTKASLDDVYVKIDYSRMSPEISIREWDENKVEEQI